MYSWMQFKNKFKTLFYITFLGLVVLLVMFLILKISLPLFPENFQDTISQLLSNNFNQNGKFLKNYILSFGNDSRFAFIGLQISQVIIAPIPGQITIMLGGYIFGFWEGLLYTMIGVIIGSFASMLIGRIFGITIVNKFIPKKILEKFDYLLSEKSLNTFFIIFLLPFFPDDSICYIAGLTRIKLWKLISVCFIGRLPGIAVYSYMGSEIGKNMTIALVIFTLALILSTAYWLFVDKSRKIL
jgi:uncharacterized membrane protein YdjX (TVP38/TMEM64 family)